MATIKASCPTCGDVELTSRDVRVLLCSTTDQGSYTFRCPMCHLAVAKQAEKRIVDLLVSSGVAMSTWEMPSELDEIHEGSQINHDDLLQFHFELQDDTWLERMNDVAGRNEPS